MPMQPSTVSVPLRGVGSEGLGRAGVRVGVGVGVGVGLGVVGRVREAVMSVRLGGV
ncbi:hypothetical protein [Streptomyces sp. 6N223]|uniref:hypothetical protein n=1 Tax=Streptomyces sp. 6N223 TaxID=3457412 RepID=UPI003FD1F68C